MAGSRVRTGSLRRSFDTMFRPPALVGLAALAAAAATPCQTAAPPLTISYEVPTDRPPGPIRVALPEAWRTAAFGAGATTDGTPIQFTSGGDGPSIAWFQATPLAAGEHHLEFAPTAGPWPFSIVERSDARTLLVDDRPVLRFECAFDPDNLELTKKPFHQVIAASDGQPITKGAGGQFPHHRGLFLGWSKTRAGDGPSYDFWHLNRGETQQRVMPLEVRIGPVAATTVDRIHWNAPDGATIVRETRTVTAWNTPQLAFLDFEFVLEAGGDETVILGGDPQHAGFQFRAANEVNDHQELTVYQRPGSATGGKNDVWRDLSWCRLITPIRDRRYAILHLSHPDNGDGWVYSTRAYGRFGAFKPEQLVPGEPLTLRFRVIVEDLGPRDAETAPTVDGDAALAAFAHTAAALADG